MKTIKKDVISMICWSNCVEPNDLVCLLDAHLKIISDYWYYGFYIPKKGVYCFYWTDIRERIFSYDIMYFTNYIAYCKHVNKRLHL